MTDIALWPDVESMFCDLLPTFASGLTTGLVTPADLTAVLPFARVHRVSGADDLVTDTADLVIDVFAGTRAAAKTASDQIRVGLVLNGPHVLDGAVIDAVRTLAGPSEVPWSPDVRRLTSTYRATTRRTSA